MVMNKAVMGLCFALLLGVWRLQPPAKRLGKNPGREHHGFV